MARPRPAWVLPDRPVPADFLPLQAPLLRQVLWSRRDGVGPDFDSFIEPDYGARPRGLAMTGMRDAAQLVVDALSAGQRIAIFGDYDADGVTATAVLNRGLRALGGEVLTYIPHRINDGYGLNSDGLQELDRQGARLVISCDCGTNSVDVVAGRPSGQRLIITDHHLPAAEIAQPDALLNPHQLGDAYPFKELSGAGVAFKLVETVIAQMPDRADRVDVDGLLQLVAIGAIADVVPLLGENRALVRRGLESLQVQPLPGLAALIEVGQLRRPIDSRAVSFQIAPRINAAGRMDDARLALDLLLAEDEEAARPLAELLEQHNLSRREATERAVAEAEELLGVEEDPAAIVLADPGWSLGLVGLIAGRMVDGHSAPAFILNWGEQECRGSARSVEGLNVVEALDACAAYLTRYGGHAMAAGFSCPTDQLALLAEGLKAYAAGLRPDGGWVREMPIDGEIRLTELSLEAVHGLDALEPCGAGNPQPRFLARRAQIRWAQPFGMEGEHLKLYLAHSDQPDSIPPLEAIGWRRGGYINHYKRAWERGDLLDVVFCPEISQWDGAEMVRLELEDVRRAEVPAAVLAELA